MDQILHGIGVVNSGRSQCQKLESTCFSHEHILFEGFHKWGYPKIDGLYEKTLLKLMIWG